MSIYHDPSSPYSTEIQEEALRLMAKYGEDASQVAEDMQGTYRDSEPQAAFWEAVAREIVRRGGEALNAGPGS